MRIAISMRVSLDKAHNETWDLISQDWQILFEPMGHTLCPIPNSIVDVYSWLEAMDIQGIILSGGNTVGHPLANKEGVFPNRDKTESNLIQYAEMKSLPLLAVCRGFQMLNRYYGGRIVPNFYPGSERGQHVACFHDIELVDTSWSKLAGQNRITVNSYHDDGIPVSNLAAPLILSATSDNGQFVEAARHPNHPFVGIMWHPERENRDTILETELIKNLFG